MLEILRTELKGVQQFIETLQQEQVALTGADIDALIPLSQSKSKQADALRLLAQQRSQLLGQAGLSSDRTGMDAWLAQQPPVKHQELKKLWDELLQAGRSAQRLNETNGKLIKIHLQHNQQALSTLANAANSASVYGPDGQHHAVIPSSGRTLGKV